MTRLSRRRLLAAGSAALVAAACSPAVTTPSATSSAATAGGLGAPAIASPAAPPIRIGVLLPYTESAVNGDIGAAQKKAADLYLRQHGGALGGRAVTLVWSDESVDPALDKTKAQFLLQDEMAEILLGGGGSAAAYALRDAAESAHVVYVDTNATANALTRALPACTPSCRSAYVFRTSATAWQLSEPLGEWGSKNGHKEFFVAAVDEPFGAESAAAFAEGLAKNGARVTGRSLVPAGTGDWAKVMAAVKAQPAKDVLAVFLTDDAAAFLAAWKGQALAASGYRLYGPGPLTDQQVLSLTKQAGVGTITSQLWTSELESAETKALVEAFRKEYTDEDAGGGPLTPDAYAVLMWDAVRALDLALARTKGDAAADVLIPALEAVSFQGPRGDFAFDKATHGLVQDVYVCEVRASGAGAVNAVVDTVAKVADPGR
jgi:branched-chain amino acid transport system substrate-binding protein